MKSYLEFEESNGGHYVAGCKQRSQVVTERISTPEVRKFERMLNNKFKI